MSISHSGTSLAQSFINFRFTFFNLIRSEQHFLLLIAVLFFIAGFSYPYPGIAMWVGFMLAGYSAIANDSIQTVGTFISSNQNKAWWILWLFIGLIFVATTSYSWAVFDGDVSFQRLTAKGFETAPQSFTFLQLAAPIFLLILTRMRMPVSTTFLLLSCFSADVAGIEKMLLKSVSGYGVAFVGAYLVWLILSQSGLIKFKGKAHPGWSVAQWISSGSLWAVWIMQDAANIAVYLPRSLSLEALIFMNSFIFLGLGLLFYLRGGRIQEVVTQKTDVLDVRPATIIDLVYALVLLFFVWVSVIPMSTTWVFIGLLAGRELGMRTFLKKEDKTMSATFRLIGKDLLFALIGLAVSITLAAATNPAIFAEIFNR
ncbi:MAG TPA: hypothetical protein VFM80_02260 [Gracilimonas sp.]|uniref:hypothetical protein n=1 Tax=Gracilimonas sp. TaxID=1974203 RepID=UPI002DB04A1C|nr:hypothetical protein [Gracilimonas sp.]